jgi:hypothetical protein
MVNSQVDKHAATKAFVVRDLKTLRVKDVDWANASDPTPNYKYNCFGLAVRFERWWQMPIYQGGKNMTPYAHWPAGLPSNNSIDAFIAAAKLRDFVLCSEAEWKQSSAEKIILYHDGDDFTHAARYVGNGQLLSKFGRLSDFPHPIEALEGVYGDGRKYMVKAGQPKVP